MIRRRRILELSAGILAAHSLGLRASEASPSPVQRPIPSSGELIPVMGMGTSRTFDTPGDDTSLAQLAEVLGIFFRRGGSIIDSSPMYGEAESRVGDVLRNMADTPRVFAATKGRDQGIAQMEESARRMNVDRFDLIAVHNLVDWQTHMTTLKQWKEEGKVFKSQEGMGENTSAWPSKHINLLAVNQQN